MIYQLFLIYHHHLLPWVYALLVFSQLISSSFLLFSFCRDPEINIVDIIITILFMVTAYTFDTIIEKTQTRNPVIQLFEYLNMEFDQWKHKKIMFLHWCSSLMIDTKLPNWGAGFNMKCIIGRPFNSRIACAVRRERMLADGWKGCAEQRAYVKSSAHPFHPSTNISPALFLPHRR